MTSFVYFPTFFTLADESLRTAAHEGSHLATPSGEVDRRARLERIAMLLNGPPSGKIHRASTYFTLANEADARRIAASDGVVSKRPEGCGSSRRPPGQVGEATIERHLYGRC